MYARHKQREQHALRIRQFFRICLAMPTKTTTDNPSLLQNAPTSTLRLTDAAVDIQHAAHLLRMGQLVAIPTETVYGLGGLGLDPDAVQRIFAAKGRPAHNPLILHVHSFAAALPLWRRDTPEAERSVERAEKLAAAFWPGPLTLVSWRAACVPDAPTAGLDKVAVRLPNHPIAQQILRIVDEPIAAPSANASFRPSPTEAAHVLLSLDGKIAAVVDGGPCEFGLESTVVDVTGVVPRVLRAGAISLDAIQQILPDTIAREAGQAAHQEASPGLLSKHYAPLVPSIRLADVDIMQQHWHTLDAMIARSVVLQQIEKSCGKRSAEATTIGLPDDPFLFGKDLYRSFYLVEKSQPAALWLEDPRVGMTTNAWLPVRDRLLRATG